MLKETGKVKKVDYKKEFKHIYKAPAKEPAIVEVPSMKYIMIDGQGDPNDSEYQECIPVLFGLSFGIKFILKKDVTDPFDYVVMPLEGLWYSDDPSVFEKEIRDKWKWTSMIMQPERVTQEIFEKAKETLKKKKNLPGIEKARLEVYNEGLSAQIMHVGPFIEEGATVEKLHKFIDDNRYTFNGDHHEIYLSDFRKCVPEKLKTIIRHPIKKTRL